MGDVTETPTAEEVRRVRRAECHTDGHRLETVLTGGIPTHVLCGRCGETWADCMTVQWIDEEIATFIRQFGLLPEPRKLKDALPKPRADYLPG